MDNGLAWPNGGRANKACRAPWAMPTRHAGLAFSPNTVRWATFCAGQPDEHDLFSRLGQPKVHQILGKY